MPYHPDRDSWPHRPLSLPATLAALAVAACALLASPLPAAPDHLVITEVCVMPTAGEFVEIFNPLTVPVDLGHTYLTDANDSYYLLPTGAGAGGVPGDFNARFPAGAVIPPRGVVCVSLAGSASFAATYGRQPDYELFEDEGAPDGVPEMVGVAGSNLGLATLTNASEIVVLYTWDGAADLVADVDMFVWGSNALVRVDKTGLAVDGPDAGTAASSYRADTVIAAQRPQVGVQTAAFSYRRVDLLEAGETMIAGNGVLGHDETSEDWSASFALAPVSPGATPVPVGAADTASLRASPNPFNPRTTIGFELAQDGRARLAVFDVRGRLVRVLADGELAAGRHDLVWDGRDAAGRCAPSGLYLARLVAGRQRLTVDLTLVR